MLVFSCGVGVQTFARMFAGKRVYAACDTIRLPGFQGVTPLEYDCDQCGECYLNLTGGICPITACSKSLLNGQCGGTRTANARSTPRWSAAGSGSSGGSGSWDGSTRCMPRRSSIISTPMRRSGKCRSPETDEGQFIFNEER